MEISISDIISVASLLLGGGGIGWFFSWKFTRRKELAEAEQAETTAAKEMQDMYQQLIDDMKKDRAYQREYIEELRAERTHLRQERDELRERQDKTDEMVRQLQRDVARNGRQIEAMRPFLCYVHNCPHRQLVDIQTENPQDKEDIEPIEREAL